MLDQAEFSLGEIVSYWNGKTFFKVDIRDLRLNPIDDIIEYRVVYRAQSGSSGEFVTWTTPFNIKQSVHFKGD